MFQISLPNRIFAGSESLQSIGKIVDEVSAAKILVMTDPAIKKTGLLDTLIKYLPDGCEYQISDHSVPEPSYKDVENVIASFDDFTPDLIIAVGGGSVMDSAKLFSILKDADYTIKDLLNDPLIGKKKIPTVMVPTTCGTGAEVTFNAIVSIPEEMVKKGIVNPQMTPDYVVIDPEMVRNLPGAILASTALDALCHGMECFTSNKANPVSDVFALECTKGIMTSVRQAFSNPADIQARFRLQMAALYGGLAISSSGTHLVHALSYPLGGKYHIPHGVSNAVLLHAVMQFDADACADKLGLICDAVNPSMNQAGLDVKVDYVLKEIDAIMDALQLPRNLSSFGVGKKDLDFLVEAASQQQRLLVNNLKPVTKADIRAIYEKVLE